MHVCLKSILCFSVIVSYFTVMSTSNLNYLYNRLYTAVHAQSTVVELISESEVIAYPAIRWFS